MNGISMHNQLVDYLIREGANADTFSVGEPLGDNMHNLIEDHGLWKVFYFERGSRFDEEQFGSRAEAVDEFCRRVLADSSNA